MPELDRKLEQTIRERAYLIWVNEGRPEGRRKTIGGARLSRTLARCAGKVMNPWRMKKKFWQAGPTRTSRRC